MCIEWLFFDVGNTLVDESKAYETRLREAAALIGKPYELIQEEALDFYRQNDKGDLAVMDKYGIPKPKWPKEDERLYPETVEVLKALKAKYKIGVIANQSLGTAARLQAWGILQFIDLVIASAEEGVSKPDPRIFEIALGRADCKAEHAVMIGDRIDNDVVPAKKMGMKTIWVKQGMGKYWIFSDESERPDYEVDSLSELLEVL
jgi:HAD superfamily hydrolase (TIGR01662 family)